MFLWWRRSESRFVFSWNLSAEFSVKTPSSSMSSVGSSSVNNTLLFLLDTLVLTSSENMLWKSPLSPLGELVEARVVSGSAAKGTDFLESMVSKLSKVSFDLPFLDLNWWKNPVWLLFERRFPSRMFSSKPPTRELSLKNCSRSSKLPWPPSTPSYSFAWTYFTLCEWETLTPIINWTKKICRTLIDIANGKSQSSCICELRKSASQTLSEKVGARL